MNAAAVALRTGIIRGPMLNTLDFRMFDVSIDGAIWATDGNTVAVWSVAKSSRVNIGKVRTPGGASPAVSAVSGSLAYFVHTINNNSVIVPFRRNGAADPLPALPGGEAPAGVTAASDGTVWAIGSKRNLYAMNGNQWKQLPLPAGNSFVSVSVGASNFAVAVTTRDSAHSVSTFDGSSWREVVKETAGGAAWVGACDDGTFWFANGSVLKLVLGDGSKVSFTLGQFPTMAARFAAANRYACYFADLQGLSIAAYGVLDQPSFGWAELSAHESAAYDAINTRLRIGDPAGVRGQYTNLTAPISEWYTDVNSMQRPDDVPEPVWKRFRDLICAELKAVDSVKQLFSNLKLLNLTIAQRLSDIRARVTIMVGLPEETHDQPKTLIDLVLETLLQKAFDAALEKVPQEMTKAVNIALAIAQYAADQKAKSLGAPDAGSTIQIACADLAKTLNDVQDATARETATTVSTILTDQQKLAAAGNAIVSGLWFWSPGFDVKVIAGLGVPAELQMYQMLMPVRWSILRFETLFVMGAFSRSPYPSHAPSVALMFKSVADKDSNMLFWWWVCAANGAPPDRDATGPFPNAALLRAIMRISRPLDFFTGAAGWKLPVNTAPGWNAPPDGLPWQPWIDADSPLQLKAGDSEGES